jgi:phosphoglucosamine mutase
MRHLFGTDGIRGIAGRTPLAPKDVTLIGRAAGRVMRKKFPDETPRIIIVRDTRVSGPQIFKHLSDGLRAEGVDVYNTGVLCTPSVAHLVRAHRFHSGAVISASHNPPEFNGIKFFTGQARKWPNEWELEVEQLFEKGIAGAPKLTGQLVEAGMLADDYKQFVLASLPAGIRFDQLRIAVDCANGANYVTAPSVLEELGARLYKFGVNPTGKNINVKCGSQHTEALSRLVKKNRCHVGVAFDGDGDRVIFVDEKGRTIDGDYVLALLSRRFKQKGLLKNNKTVITVMANLGLRKALAKLGVKSVVTPVGDRHVSQAMKMHKSVLGGEQSGHIILGEHLPTGDGLLTAVHVLAALVEDRKPFSKMVGWMEKFPQVLLNVTVKERVPLEKLPDVQKEIKSAEKILGEDGRVLVRYSGTEPLLRIMLEGPNKSMLEKFAANIATAVKKS